MGVAIDDFAFEARFLIADPTDPIRHALEVESVRQAG
jgi:hypothetical protein